MVLTWAINGMSLYPYGAAHLTSNFLTRFMAISLVVALIAGVRRTYVREWWLARTDALTGALNRQAFFELATTATDCRSWRLLMYADLDGLKQLNDGKGHQTGDSALKAFAAAVRTTIRTGDVFARVGGDEFLIFMAVKDEAAGRTVATRLHSRMNSISISASEQVRCSVGALVVCPGERSLDDLVRSADDLMYKAKLRGASLELGSVSDPGRCVPTGRARTRARVPVSASQRPPRINVVDRRASAANPI
jgi:diguanylate cyclase (GGDEF)-like protein